MEEESDWVLLLSPFDRNISLTDRFIRALCLFGMANIAPVVPSFLIGLSAHGDWGMAVDFVNQGIARFFKTLAGG